MTTEKVPLSECEELQFDSFVRTFRTNGEIKSKLRITTPIVDGWVTDYQADTMKAKKFILMAHADKTGVQFEITEEMLVKMLLYIKNEKEKVYSIEGC